MSPPEPDPPPMWSPMADAPEMLAFAFLQEDAPVGPITSWRRAASPQARHGRRDEAPRQRGRPLQRTQSLQWPVDTEAAVTYRWWVGIAHRRARLQHRRAHPHRAFRERRQRLPPAGHAFEMGQLQSSIRDAAAQGTIGAAVNTADFSKWHVVMGFTVGGSTAPGSTALNCRRAPSAPGCRPTPPPPAGSAPVPPDPVTPPFPRPSPLTA